MILQKKEELANRQLRLTITVERDAWEKALNDAYQEVKALYPVEGYAVGKAPVRRWKRRTATICSIRRR